MQLPFEILGEIAIHNRDADIKLRSTCNFFLYIDLPLSVESLARRFPMHLHSDLIYTASLPDHMKIYEIFGWFQWLEERKKITIMLPLNTAFWITKCIHLASKQKIPSDILIHALFFDFCWRFAKVPVV